MKRKYKEGDVLAENEFLLKVRRDATGFLTKFNKDGSMPKAFENWNMGYWDDKTELPIYVVKETPRMGWKLHEWRIGKSQEWAVMWHPDGYKVEIYLSNFLEIVKNHTIINGEIEGSWQWEANKLIQK